MLLCKHCHRFNGRNASKREGKDTTVKLSNFAQGEISESTDRKQTDTRILRYGETIFKI